jgi:hypothetical protein
MLIWHLGANAVSARLQDEVVPVDAFMAKIEMLFVLTVTTKSVPWVRDTERLGFEEIAPRFWRAAAHYGFMAWRDQFGAYLARPSSSHGPSGMCRRSWRGMSSTTARCTCSSQILKARPASSATAGGMAKDVNEGNPTQRMGEGHGVAERLGTSYRCPQLIEGPIRVTEHP